MQETTGLGQRLAPGFVAFTLCAFVVARARQPERLERWAWRVFLTGCVIGCVGVLLEYWTQWTGRVEGDGLEARIFAFAFVFAMVGLPLIVLGATAVGIVLLVKGFSPVVPALLLAAMVPLDLAIAQVTSMGSLLLPVMFAFGLLGRRLARDPGAIGRARSRSPETVTTYRQTGSLTG